MLFWSLVFCLAGETLGSTANAKACCAAAGVSSWCVENFCNAEASGSDVTNIVAAQCALNRSILSIIARCLADGRNHLPCCQSHATEYLSCLHLCNGTAPSVDTSAWIGTRRFHNGSSFHDYSACLNRNLGEIFTCIRGGYASGPFPPKSVNARSISPTEALITWQPPENFRDRVKMYVVSVSYRNMHGLRGSPHRYTRNETSLKIRNLYPDTEYVVNVVTRNRTEPAVSLPSKVVFVTEGVAPVAKPFVDDIVYTDDHATITLVCYHEVQGHISNVTMEWLKLSESEYNPVDVTRKLEDNRKKFETKSYLVTDITFGTTRPGIRTFVHTLKITDIESSDFGSYKCASKNLFGEASGVVMVKQTRGVTVKLGGKPVGPKNSTACCLSLMKAVGCEDAKCDFTNHGNVRLMPGQRECAAMETVAMLWCTIYAVDIRTCCLREEVPYYCRFYCEGYYAGFDWSTMRGSLLRVGAAGCLDHYSNGIAKCRLEFRQGIPNPPSNVEVTASIHVSWEAVRNAEHYFVYYRVAGEDWRSERTDATSITLRNLTRRGRYKIIVLSGNHAGQSENSDAAYITLA